MMKQPFNGSIRRSGMELLYRGVIHVLLDARTGTFHASFDIHVEDKQERALNAEKHVTLVGVFATEHEALDAAIKQTRRYFR